MVIFLILLSLVAANLYRMGGDSRFNTIWRDIGVPVCVAIYLSMNGHFNIALAGSLVLLWAAMTTYFGFVNKWFGRDEEESWINWTLIGLSYNIAMLPTIWQSGRWNGFYIRLAVLPLLFVGSNALVDWFHFNIKNIPDRAAPKERFRGFLTMITIPILLIK